MKKSLAATLLVLFFTTQNCVESEKSDPLEDLINFFIFQQLVQNLNPAPASTGNSNVTEAKDCSGDQSNLNDPLFKYQWHLKNTGNPTLNGTGATANSDAQVEGAWRQGCTGSGINIVVVDDGVDLVHEDLRIKRDLSKDYTNQLSDHKQAGQNYGLHGTAVAGVAAGAGNNGIGVAGAAWEANIGSRNILMQNDLSSSSPDAMRLNMENIHISNNSWGATDSTGDLNAGFASELWKTAVEEGIKSGRNGKGSLYFWAAGNGAFIGNGFPDHDNSNHDGQANFHGVIAVGAVGNNDLRATYSEQGANLWVAAHSEGPNTVKSVTTDLMGGDGINIVSNGVNVTGSEFNNNYTNSFNGTSSATPLAAGVAALVLQANPNLNYRDVKLILAESARKVDTSDAGWFKPGGKRTDGTDLEFNHKYGFGVVDANKAVSLAKNWSNVGSEIVSNKFSRTSLSTTINDYNGSSLVSAQDNISVSGTGIGKIEFIEVEVTVNSGTTNPGDLIMALQPPGGGFQARLMNARPCIEELSSAPKSVNCTAFTAWRMGVSTFLNTPADGTWTLFIADAANGTNPYGFGSGVTRTASHTGNHTLTSWSIKFRGRAN